MPMRREGGHGVHIFEPRLCARFGQASPVGVGSNLRLVFLTTSLPTCRKERTRVASRRELELPGAEASTPSPIEQLQCWVYLR